MTAAAAQAEVLDLLAATVEALLTADGELGHIAELTMPLPALVQERLDRELTYEAMLKRIKAATNDQGRAKLDAMYNEEKGKRTSLLDGGKVPVRPEVRQRINAALEVLRREVLLNRNVADALRAIL